MVFCKSYILVHHLTPDIALTAKHVSSIKSGYDRVNVSPWEMIEVAKRAKALHPSDWGPDRDRTNGKGPKGPDFFSWVFPYQREVKSPENDFI